MHITIIATGTRGDVQPMLALAIGLRTAGHRVRFATEAGYAASANAADLEYFPMTGNSEGVFSGRVGLRFRELIEKPHTPEMQQKYTASFAGSLWMQQMRRHYTEIFAASERTDVVICQSWMGMGPSIAEKQRIPVIVAALFPVPERPTAAFPSPWQALQSSGMTTDENRRTWDAWPELWERSSYTFVQEWRVDVLKLPRQSPVESLEAMRRVPHVLGYSPSVLPKPDDWGEGAHVTGFWFLDSAPDYAASDELKRFLEAGDPPVAVGFGSLVGHQPARLTRVVLEALQSVGRRGLLIQGWGGLKCDELPVGMLSVPTVPYDWLLPRTSGIVHHGGVGTMAVALKAGTTQAIASFGMDQSFWGHRAAALGVSPLPLTAKSITAEQLAGALETIVNDRTMRQRAVALGDSIRRERGVERAVQLIEQIASV